MSIVVSRNHELSRFEIHVDSELAGFAEYKLHDKTIVFPHTEIDPKFGGRGLGTKLIKHAIHEAGDHGLLIEPLCPFVQSYLERIGQN
jgi:predicted GNAT family acetyltransferase